MVLSDTPPAGPVVVEWLEGRVHLTTFTAIMSAQPTGSLGSSYTIDLYTTGGAASQWEVFWTPSSPQFYYATSYTGNHFPAKLQVGHTYSTAPTSPITAVATLASNTSITATAYFALNSSYGNNHFQGDGQSLYTPYGNQGSIGQDAMVVDNITSDHFEHDSFIAHPYVASVGGNPQFAVTLMDPSGQFVSSWGNNGTYVVPSFGGGSDIPYAIDIVQDGSGQGTSLLAVVGKCATGWAIATVTTGLNGSTYGNYGWLSSSSFQAGQANAVTIDKSDSGAHFVAVGTDGTHVVACALKTGLAGTTAGDPFWSGTGIKTLSVPTGFVSATANSVVELDDGPEAVHDDEVLVIGGTATCSCTCAGWGAYSDFNLVELNDGDGSVARSTVTNLEPYVPSSCSGALSTDSCYGLAVWYDGANQTQYVYAVGSSNAAPGFGHAQQFAVVRYLTSDLSRDSSFGYNSTGVKIGPNGVAYSCALLSDSSGNLITAGAVSSDFEAAQFLGSTGNLDSSFGNNGVMQTDFGATANNSADTGWSVGLQEIDSGGTFTVTSILVCGTSIPSGSSTGQIALADYLLTNQVVIS